MWTASPSGTHSQTLQKEEEDRRPTSSPQLTTGKGDWKLRMVRHAKDEHGRRSRHWIWQAGYNPGLWPQAQVPKRKKTQRHHQWQLGVNASDSTSTTTITGCDAFYIMMCNYQATDVVHYEPRKKPISDGWASHSARPFNVLHGARIDTTP